MRSAHCFSFALLLVCATARAEGTDPVAAEQLFTAARAAMDQGDYATACSRFAESQRLDPAAGTLINLAECLDRRGLVASSWQRWKEALEALRPGDDRLPAVTARVKAAEARLPRLDLRLAEGAPPGSRVERDGLELGAASLGIALPVDPGEHRVTVIAEGREPRAYDVTLAEREVKELVVEPGAPVKVESPPAPAAPAQAPPAASLVAAPAPAPEPSSGATRTWGFAVAGAGAVSLGVGATFGLLALGKKGTVDDECTENGAALDCSAAGVDAANTGKTYATVANIAGALGVVALGAGITLIVVGGPGRAEAAVSARPVAGGGALDVLARF